MASQSEQDLSFRMCLYRLSGPGGRPAEVCPDRTHGQVGRETGWHRVCSVPTACQPQAAPVPGCHTVTPEPGLETKNIPEL